MSNSDNEKIPSVDFPPPTAPVLGMGNTQQIKQEQQKNTKILAGIFVLLLILVVGVIFVLPRYISPAIPKPVAGTASAAAPTGVSPYQEAQQLQNRKDAQDILAALLEKQEALQEQQAQVWAAEKFAAAIEQANKGDEVYSQQQFSEAQTFYQAGLELMLDIEASAPETFLSFMETGNQAILSDKAETAEQAFHFASLIMPDNIEATTSYNRAQSLSKVLELLDQGNTLHEEGSLESARQIYQQAKAIDNAHIGVNAALKQVNTDITDRNFLGAMSQGYAAIQNDSPELAKTAFTQALGIKPDSKQARQALEQADEQIASTAINQSLNRALTFESAEEWQQALKEYNLALVVDPNLVAALEGRSRSTSRNNLDVFLKNTLQEPLRLADSSVYQQALRVHQDASKITSPGSKLATQLQQLGTFLDRITKAASVQFVSDGLTNVTVYQVSSLGLFTSQTLALTPGTYVAVGVREGYRDVRQEFIIPLDGQVPTITVQCIEKLR